MAPPSLEPWRIAEARSGSVGTARAGSGDGFAMNKIPDPNEEPYLPEVGEVYWVNSTITTQEDQKPGRPMLVMKVPEDTGGIIDVVTRTSKTQHRPGVPSAIDPALRLDKPGVWGYPRKAYAFLWTPSMVEWRGKATEELLEQVREEFGL